MQVTNTLVNGATILASEHNVNYADIVAGLQDGTKNLRMLDIAALGTLTVTGVSTFNGAVTINAAATAASTLAVTGVATLATYLTQSGSNIAKTSAPVADTIYPNSQVKAWAVLTCGAAGAVTVTDGFNINTASYSSDDMTVNFHTNLAAADYSVVITGEAVSGFSNSPVCGGYVKTSSRAVGSFHIIGNKRDGSSASFASGDILHIMVLGTQ